MSSPVASCSSIPSDSPLEARLFSSPITSCSSIPSDSTLEAPLLLSASSSSCSVSSISSSPTVALLIAIASERQRSSSPSTSSSHTSNAFICDSLSNWVVQIVLRVAMEILYAQIPITFHLDVHSAPSCKRSRCNWQQRATKLQRYVASWEKCTACRQSARAKMTRASMGEHSSSGGNSVLKFTSMFPPFMHWLANIAACCITKNGLNTRGSRSNNARVTWRLAFWRVCSVEHMRSWRMVSWSFVWCSSLSEDVPGGASLSLLVHSSTINLIGITTILATSDRSAWCHWSIDRRCCFRRGLGVVDSVGRASGSLAAKPRHSSRPESEPVA